jgi:NAD dependent epimerase/dehydratase family enzyme
MSSIMLYGSRISAEKILSKGFTFEFADINLALSNLLGK